MQICAVIYVNGSLRLQKLCRTTSLHHLTIRNALSATLGSRMMPNITRLVVYLTSENRDILNSIYIQHMQKHSEPAPAQDIKSEVSADTMGSVVPFLPLSPGTFMKVCLYF